MATFKVGDRVRIACCVNPAARVWVGSEDVIEGESIAYPGCFFLRRAQQGTNGFKIAWQPQHLVPILPTPTAMDILAMANLPERDCIAPVTLNAPEWPRWEGA